MFKKFKKEADKFGRSIDHGIKDATGVQPSKLANSDSPFHKENVEKARNFVGIKSNSKADTSANIVRVDELKNSTASIELQIQELNGKRAELKGSIQDYDDKISKLKNDLERLKSDGPMGKMAAIGIKKALANLDEERKNTDNELDRVQTNLVQLEQQYKDNEAKAAAITTQFTNSEETVDSNNNSITTKEEQTSPQTAGQKIKDEETQEDDKTTKQVEELVANTKVEDAKTEEKTQISNNNNIDQVKADQDSKEVAQTVSQSLLNAHNAFIAKHGDIENIVHKVISDRSVTKQNWVKNFVTDLTADEREVFVQEILDTASVDPQVDMTGAINEIYDLPYFS